MTFILPELPYGYDALEPHIDARTMEIHHSKHHAGYVAKLNAALEPFDEYEGASIESIMTELKKVPDEIRTAVRNNGGGHANHSLFWNVMGPDGGGEPGGSLAGSISNGFNSFAEFKDKFSKAAATRFGSGWAWLVVGAGGGLVVLSTPNQDTPLSEEVTPILGLDVWEHAYYLNYQNRRPDYIAAWWNVINWSQVEANYNSAVG
ncbi:MAG: superoxide dismutase [Anaerolineales bacterium]